MTHLVKKEITIKTHLQQNSNENTVYQNICESAKAILDGKFITLNAYTGREKSPKLVI